jgi:hypothetical protein
VWVNAYTILHQSCHFEIVALLQLLISVKFENTRGAAGTENPSVVVNWRIFNGLPLLSMAIESNCWLLVPAAISEEIRQREVLSLSFLQDKTKASRKIITSFCVFIAEDLMVMVAVILAL